jgi:hypothetical protein
LLYNYESNLTTGEEIEIDEEKELSIVVHRRLCRVKNMLAMYLKYFRYIANIFLTLHKGL